MSKTFSASERKVIEVLSNAKSINFKDEQYRIEKIGKPRTPKGECKTDIYILLKGKKSKEIKISFKQKNADFLENKMSSDRAKEIFGNDWKNILIKSLSTIKDEFLKKDLIYRERKQRVEKGCFTLGWKFELLNKKSGELSGILELTNEQKLDVYAGGNLPDDKKNAIVDGERIDNSGIANYILTADIDGLKTQKDVVDNLVELTKFINSENVDIYFACKALNYRSLHKPEPKWDGDRPLAVYVNWKVQDGFLTYDLVFDNPLIKKGNEVAEKLKQSLRELRISNTNEIDENNVKEDNIIFG